MAVMRLQSLAIAMLASLAYAQTPMDKTLVVVNGLAIDGKTYYKRMEVLPNTGQLVNGKFVQATPGYLALSKLIDETLMIQLAVEKGVAPTEAEITNTIKERTDETPGLVEALAKIGFSMDDLRYDTKVQLSEYKLQTMGINITDMELEKFYKENPSMYTLPKRFKLSVIAVDTDEKKRAVDDALNSGKKFGQVAKEMSVDITKGDEGQMGEVAERELAKETLAAITAAKKGGVTDWIASGEVSAKFFVEDVLEKKVVPLDATLKAQIRRNLMLDRGRVKNNLGQMMNNMRAKSKIEFQGTVFDELLKKSFGKG